MKKILFLSIVLLLLVCGISMVVSQDKKIIVVPEKIEVEEDFEILSDEEIEEGNVVFKVVETMPEFPGGNSALMKYIAENIQYPAKAMEKGIQGRVICQCVVEKDGKPSNVQVVRSSGDPSLDKEAIRLISTMPNWIPGKHRGKTVRVCYTLPVNFRLQ